MKKGITKKQFIDWAISRNWEKDKWGHLQKTSGGKQYRFKISTTSVRYEVKIHFEPTKYGPKSEWMRLRSGYFKDLYFTAEGKLVGLR